MASGWRKPTTQAHHHHHARGKARVLVQSGQRKVSRRSIAPPRTSLHHKVRLSIDRSALGNCSCGEPCWIRRTSSAHAGASRKAAHWPRWPRLPLVYAQCAPMAAHAGGGGSACRASFPAQPESAPRVAAQQPRLRQRHQHRWLASDDAPSHHAARGGSAWAGAATRWCLVLALWLQRAAAQQVAPPSPLPPAPSPPGCRAFPPGATALFCSPTSRCRARQLHKAPNHAVGGGNAPLEGHDPCTHADCASAGAFAWGSCSFSFDSSYTVGLFYNTTFGTFCAGMAGTTPSSAQCRVLAPRDPNAAVTSVSWWVGAAGHPGPGRPG